MDMSNSKWVVLAALIANALIACVKFIAAMITHSSAMLSEGIHSLVDVGNQALLLFGLKRAKKAADAEHPFGYGKEIYFWSFIVAILLFALGGGLSLKEGISHWSHPTPIKHIFLSYAVLGVAFIFELTAWMIAMKAFKKRQSHRNWIRSIHRAKDPALIVILLEDSAALIGLVIAFVGISISYWWGLPRVDAIASMSIGAVLLVVSAWLAYESKHLLIGESADPKVVSAIREIVAGHPHIEATQKILTMHMGPDEIVVNLYVDFRDNIASQEIEDAVSEVEKQIKARVPTANWVYIAARSFSKRLAS